MIRNELNCILDKIRQDLEHRLAALEVKSILESIGARVYLMNCYDDRLDLFVNLPSRSIRLGVKSRPPP